VRRIAVLVAIAALAAGCGGGGTTRISADHATLTGVTMHASSVAFAFDVQPDTVQAAYAARGSLAECGSGRPVRPGGGAFVVVHFRPAQTQSVPKRIVMPSGQVLDLWKLCDFEADVGWVIGVAQKLPIHVSRDGGTVTITFG
jgi:hypothetical protein